MARTELCRDKPFDPSHPLNILVKLKASDTGLSNTLTMPKELVEKNLFPWFSKHRCVKLSQHDSVQLVDLFEYDSKILWKKRKMEISNFTDGITFSIKGSSRLVISLDFGGINFMIDLILNYYRVLDWWTGLHNIISRICISGLVVFDRDWL